MGMEDSLIRLEKSIYGSDEVQMKNIYVHDTLTGDTIQKTIHIYYHKVQAGEVLKNVAAHYAVTEDQIMTWNGLKTTNIYIGQHLRIESEKRSLLLNPSQNLKLLESIIQSEVVIPLVI